MDIPHIDFWAPTGFDLHDLFGGDRDGVVAQQIAAAAVAAMTADPNEAQVQRGLECLRRFIYYSERSVSEPKGLLHQHRVVATGKRKIWLGAVWPVKVCLGFQAQCCA